MLHQWRYMAVYIKKKHLLDIVSNTVAYQKNLYGFWVVANFSMENFCNKISN